MIDQKAAIEAAILQLQGAIQMASGAINVAISHLQIETAKVKVPSTIATTEHTLEQGTKQKPKICKAKSEPEAKAKEIQMGDVIAAVKTLVSSGKGDKVKELFTSKGLRKCQDCPPEKLGILYQSLKDLD